MPKIERPTAVRIAEPAAQQLALPAGGRDGGELTMDAVGVKVM